MTNDQVAAPPEALYEVQPMAADFQLSFDPRPIIARDGGERGQPPPGLRLFLRFRNQAEKKNFQSARRGQRQMRCASSTSSTSTFGTSTTKRCAGGRGLSAGIKSR